MLTIECESQLNFVTASNIAKRVIDGEPINTPGNMADIFHICRTLSMNKESLPSTESNRTCFVIPYHPLYEVGGLEIGTMQIAKNFIRKGLQADILSKGIYPNVDLSGLHMTDDGIKINGAGRGISDIVQFLLVHHDEYGVIQWMEIFPPTPEQISVYNTNAEQQYLASVLLRALGKKVYLYVATSGNVTNRGVNNPNWISTKKHQPFNILLQNGLTGFNGANRDIFEEYKQAGIKIIPHRQAFIPFGVDIDHFTPAGPEEKARIRETLHLPEDKILILNIGRFVERKRQQILLNVWDTLPQDVRDRACLIFVGGKAGYDHPDSIYSEIRDRIEKTQGAISIDLVDRATMPLYIQASDAMFFPSLREGWPLSIMEVMACGVPVFASDIEGVRDVIVTDKTGFLFDPYSEGQIRDYLMQFIQNPKRFQAAAFAGKDKVVNTWSWDKITDQYSSFYYNE